MLVLTVLRLALVWSAASGDVMAEPFEYHDGPTRCVGYVAYDRATDTRRPGVLIAPEWWGITDHTRTVARRLAQAGYVALVADVYGDGQTTEDPKRAGELASPFYADRALMRRRATAALNALRGHARVDAARVAAIGYCFGGSVVLELARAGSDVRAAVSFHGGLRTPEPAQPGRVRAHVLVITGAADPMVPADEREGFIAEMERAGARYELLVLGGAQHSFTNPAADTYNIPGVRYDRAADERSWEAMTTLFTRVLGDASVFLQRQPDR